MAPGRVAKVAMLAVGLCLDAMGQLNQNCTVAVLNRTVPANPDGTWVLPNVPAGIGQVKARATCVQNGLTTSGESTFFTVPANGAVNLPAITLGATTLIPDSLAFGIVPILSAVGQTAQLTVTAHYPDNSTRNVTSASTGTNYTISNPAIATITANGLVTAVASGTVVIQASNDGASGIASIQVVLSGASHGGIPDSWAISFGLDINDPTMPSQDPDRDGLTNLQEFQSGTNPNSPDTDGDGLTDGDEVNKYHTNPLLTDTDGDGIPDGIEIQTGSNPLDKTSYDLSRALQSFVVSPTSFNLSVSVVQPQASVQLTVTGKLIDGKTTIDLTSTQRRTNYGSSNLNVCNFGSPDGKVFAGASGNCTITITNSGFTATSTGTVSNFTPTEVSTLSVPGSVAIDVAGGFAYVAAGSGGLVVVDVTDRTKPRTRGTLSGIGDAEAVRSAGQYVFLADANGFLRVVNVLNPDAPFLVTSIPISGRPTSLASHSNLIAVAAQTSGVTLVNISNPATPSVVAIFAGAGSALGVDFDAQRGLAAVAMGTAGLQLFDISNATSPQSRGLLSGGDVRRVALKFPAALLADVQRSVTAVDITNPLEPVLTSSITPSLGGAPVDIAVFGNVGITADISFGRAVPVLDVSVPLQPRTAVFWSLASPGFGSSIAMDARFGYLIVPGTLRILQYQNIVDNAGIPPSVQITSPLTVPLIQGSTVTFSANATDDVAVVSATLLVNGQQVFTVFNPPYQTTYTVPLGISSITFGATAVDFGNNVGVASNVTLPVIPDPLTTVTGRIVDGAGSPVSGATVTTLNASTASGAGGGFTFLGLPTIQGPITVVAGITVNGVPLRGSSLPMSPVLGGTTNVGDIRVLPQPVITSVQRYVVQGMATPNFKVAGFNLTNASFTTSPTAGIAISNAAINPSGSAAVLTVSAAANASATYVLIATTVAGTSSAASSPANTFAVTPVFSTTDFDGDGLSNADEAARGTDPLNSDTDGDGYADGLEVAFGSDPLNSASIPVFQKGSTFAGFTLSLLNSINPGSTAPVRQQPSFTLSTLNSLSPGSTAPVRQQPSFTFSTLNATSPASIAPVPRLPSLTFSVLNAASPGSSAPVRLQPSFTFSLLNSLSPGSVSPVRLQPSLAFSLLNNINPGSAQRPLQIPYFIFSTLNQFSSGHTSATPFAISRTEERGPLQRTSDLRRNPKLAEMALRRITLATFGGHDSDGDGLPDVLEMMLGSDPNNPDSDGDGLQDGIEYILTGDPFSARPSDDDDGDGLTNLEEVLMGTDPANPDSDNDGLSDGDEVSIYHTDPKSSIPMATVTAMVRR